MPQRRKLTMRQLRQMRRLNADGMRVQWSNGQAEDQLTKLKFIKRQMHRRGKLDLLEARIVGVP